MIFLQEPRTQLDDLLDKMAAGIQLDETRHSRMKQSYNAVKNWIESDYAFFKPYKYDVYPHGSVRIGTTVKPIEKEEFDLDIAIHLKTESAVHNPTKLYVELKRRLNESEVYKPKIVLKNRCIRINYEGDYHMDILPGVQENIWDSNTIKVPDKELGQWVISNPRGYAGWFLDKANLVTVSLLEKAMRAENLPSDNYRDKKPLQRAVQLIKRYRDIYFQRDDTYKTSSIVLTTIAGQFYSGQDSIFDTIEDIIAALQRHISALTSRIKVYNPVNNKEDFTDKWENEPEYYTAFRNFCMHLHNEWQSLKSNQGVVNESRILKGLFGDTLFFKAQNAQTIMLENSRRNGALAMNIKTGVLSGASSAMATIIKPNTFFGS